MITLRCPNRPLATVRTATHAIRWCALFTLLGLISTCSARPSVLEQIRALGALKVATRYGPMTYYQGTRLPKGPEFELASELAARLGVPIRLLVLPSEVAILEAVAAGLAPLGAGALAITPHTDPQVTFSLPYQRIGLHLIERADASTASDLTSNDSGIIGVQAGSSAAALLRSTPHRKRGHIRDYSDRTTAQLLTLVANETLSASLADDNEFAFLQVYYPTLHATAPLSVDYALAWALPADDPRWGERINAFLATVTPDIHQRMARHTTPPAHVEDSAARNMLDAAEAHLTPLKAYFEQSGYDSGEDWRLLAAIGYQESHWEPEAVSPTGVRGIMMLTHETATDMGIGDRAGAAESIRGGAAYLHQMRDLIPDHIPEPDRTYFAIAIYNLGYGHLEDARILTQAHGKNPDLWSDVRLYLPWLRRLNLSAQLKHGYARGDETQHFVDNIQSYLESLEWWYPKGPLSAPTPH